MDLVLLAIGITFADWFLEAVQDLLRPYGRIDMAAILRAVVPVLVVGYYVVLWRLSGQTAGKWIFGLEVVTPDGKRASTLQCLLRVAGYTVSALPLYVGFLWVLFDPRRRTLHDHLSGTSVLYKAPARDQSR